MIHIIRTTAAELQRLLEPIAPHIADPLNGRTAIAQTVIVGYDGALIAVASDGMTAGFQRVQLATPAPEGVVFRLLHHEVHGLLYLLGDDDPSAVKVSITVQDDGAFVLRFTSPSHPHFTGEVSVAYAAPSSTSVPLAGVPNLSTLIPDFSSPPFADGIALELTVALDLLARFTPATLHNGPTGALTVRMPVNTRQQLAIRIGDDFLGLIAQTRLTGAATGDLLSEVIPAHTARWGALAREAFSLVRLADGEQQRAAGVRR